MSEDLKASEPLELKYKLLFFFFPPVIIFTIIIGSNYKALGYLRKEKEKWKMIMGGYLFYTVLVIIIGRFLLSSQSS